MSGLESSREAVKNERAIAKAYFFEERGLDIALYNSFTQETFEDYNTHNLIPTIRFSMPNDGYWERLLGDVELIAKDRYKSNYSHKGLAWHSENLDCSQIKELWIVESIFDAIALFHHGIYAISAMSIKNFPNKTLSEIYQINPKLSIVIALNSDDKSKKTALKWYDKVREIGFYKVSLAITSDEDDWNDKHLKKFLSPADIEKYFYHGSLLKAESEVEVAYLMHQYKNEDCFLFEYGNKTYFTSIKGNQSERKIIDSCDDFMTQYQTQEIANCTINILYAQKNIENDGLLYFVEVSMGKRKNLAALTSKQLASAGEFKSSVINIMPGAIFTGKTFHLNELYRLKASHLYEVVTLDFMGYSEEFNAYIYKNFAVHQGIVYMANQQNYIELPNDRRVKTTFHFPNFSPVMNYQNDWWEDYQDVFGVKGVVVLAYWVGTLFAEQIRSTYKAYPFLELTGEPSAGKSTILRFLWSLLGRHDYEGGNPNIASEVNNLRTLAQVSNMAIVMIEGEGYNLEIFKSAFNGGILRATAKKDHSNETNTPKFRGALVISQNERAITKGSKLNREALLSRLVFVHFDKSEHTPERRIKARRLEQMTTEEVSGFLVAALKLEEQVMTTLHSTYDSNHQRIMNLSVNEARIGLTHGLMMSLVEALGLLVPLSDSMKSKAYEYIEKIAIERDLELKHDHPALEQFWDVFETLEGMSCPVNHSRESNEIAIHLTSFHALAKSQGYQIEDVQELKRLLPLSTYHRFIERNKVVSSKFYDKTDNPKVPKSVKAYVFERIAKD